MFLVQDLNVVRSLMGANFICLEQVDLLDILRDMEVPLTKGIILQTMDWLIGFNTEVCWG